RGRGRSRRRSHERNRHGDETAGRFRRRLSLRGSKRDRSRRDVGRGGPVAGTGARVLGNEPSQLSPESTSYQPPRDVLGAVWSQCRGSLSGGKRHKNKVYRRVRRQKDGGRQRGAEGPGTAASLLMGTRARDGGGRQNRGKTGLTTQENECEKGKLRLRESRRQDQMSPRHWKAATDHAWAERGGSVRKPRGSGAAASGHREPGAAGRVRRPP